MTQPQLTNEALQQWLSFGIVPPGYYEQRAVSNPQHVVLLRDTPNRTLVIASRKSLRKPKGPTK